MKLNSTRHLLVSLSHTILLPMLLMLIEVLMLLLVVLMLMITGWVKRVWRGS